MNSQSTNQPSNQIGHIFSTFYKYKLLLILPMILGVILSAVYAIALRKETWSAKQSLIVRDDLLGQSYKPGQFDSLDSMKSAQETIFEIARKPKVIRNALQQLGPPSRGLLGLGGNGYPSEEIIEMTQGNVSFSAPNGAEFGRTEVIILNTKSGSRQRAREFTEILVGEIISTVNEVRLKKFQSMEAEILETCKVAEVSLEKAKQKLKNMDHKLGQDAGAMVAQGDSSFRDDPLSREIAQLNLERRAVRSEVEQIQSMLKSLKIAKADPEAIVNISSDLTSRQPALDSLKQEMVQQKGDYAQLSGRYTDVHPAVVSAKYGIDVMQGQIRLELANAEADTMSRLRIASAKLQRLDAGITKLKQRVTNLGEMRAESITVFADIKKRTEILNNARTNLAEVQGLTNSTNTDLLTTVDEVQVSTRPDGLGKRALMLAGGLGGLMFGMGLVMLMAPPSPNVTSQPSRNVPAPDNASSFQRTEEQTVQALDVGLAKAQSGLETSKNVLRDLIRPSSKSADSQLPQDSAELESQKQKKIDERLNSVKANKPKLKPESPESEPKPLIGEASFQSQSQPSVGAETPVAKKAESNPFLKDKPKTSSAKSAIGATILPANKEATPTSPGRSVDPAMLLKAASAQSASTAQLEAPKIETSKIETSKVEISKIETPKIETPKIEIPDVEPKQPEGDFTKLVDKAFEDETKSRVEAQTIQLDVLSKVLGTTGAAGAAGAVGLAGLAASSSAQQQDTELSNPTTTQAASARTSAPQRGAQIMPRPESVRPVELAKQSDKDAFDRVVPESSKEADSPRVEANLTEDIAEPSEKTKELIGQGGNPFLKNRSGKAGSTSSSTSTPASSTPLEEATIVPVPDQIRKLSDSIASFAKPIKSADDSLKEEF